MQLETIRGTSVSGVAVLVAGELWASLSWDGSGMGDRFFVGKT